MKPQKAKPDTNRNVHRTFGEMIDDSRSDPLIEFPIRVMALGNLRRYTIRTE
jgi:hypothetical protein